MPKKLQVTGTCLDFFMASSAMETANSPHYDEEEKELLATKPRGSLIEGDVGSYVPCGKLLC